jgi:uncharacterized SAM-binding protein YcdF (DUF218 family)
MRDAQAARLVFDFLSVRAALPPDADLIVGFGHFDRRVPHTCCDAWRTLAGGHRGRPLHVLFAGGRGAGTADVEGSEAAFFRRAAREYAPDIPSSAFLLETNSTNTSENLVNALDVLAAAEPSLRPGAGLRRVVLVATPYRQRRVWLTCLRRLPGVELFNHPPRSSYDEDVAVFQAKGQDLADLLPGEVERITQYADLGYLERSEVPAEVADACRTLTTLPREHRCID